MNGASVGSNTSGDGREADEINTVLTLTLALLEMDALYVSEFIEDQQVIRAVAGDASSFGISAGSRSALDGSYCQRMVAGEIPQVIPDADLRIAAIDSPCEMEIGARIGAAIHRFDGSLFGALCGLSREPNPRLHERDAAYLEVIGRLLGGLLHRHRQSTRASVQVRGVLHDEEQLLVALQPVVSLHDGRIVAVEALARFPGLSGPPAAVFSLARSAGLGQRLELAVIDRALTVISQLPAHCRLAVNVSPDVVTSEAFTALLRAPSVSPERLIVEITEHAAIEDYGAIVSVLTPLRKDGLWLAVDDAGAGFASFAHVLRLGPDMVKIDRSLVVALSSGKPAPRALLTAFVTIAEEMGASIIAEGVETAEELAELRDLGVSHVQGFLVGRPTTDPAVWRAWEDPVW